MKTRARLLVFILIAILLASGCARYHTPLEPPGPPETYIGAQTKGGLIIAIDPYYDPAVLRRQKPDERDTFKMRLNSIGLLPINVIVSNTSQDRYMIKVPETSVGDAQTMSRPVPVEDFIAQAKYPTGKYLPVWCAMGVVPGIIAAPQSEKTNLRIEADFKRYEFRARELAPGEKQSGYLVYRIRMERPCLDGLQINIPAQNLDTGETLEFTYLY